jgi:hypothetical protein
MNHLIKPTSLTVVLAVTVLVAGCGDSKAEKAAKERERQRMELERQAHADAAKANKAITTNNQKMFSKMNSSSPGATPTQSQPPTGVDKK